MLIEFQLTRPRGARPVFDLFPVSIEMFQLTRPRGARRARFWRFGTGDRVSTHAPAWGATSVKGDPPVEGEVSTHAPAWGATRNRRTDKKITQVSTHAPAWGATCHFETSFLFLFLCFNSRARVGRDRHGLFQSSVLERFNSRARVGRDLTSSYRNMLPSGFNSRARVGRDFNGNGHLTADLSFNSRARVGRDKHGILCFLGAQPVSTHAPAWGATILFLQLPQIFHVSTHAPAWGATYKY